MIGVAIFCLAVSSRRSPGLKNAIRIDLPLRSLNNTSMSTDTAITDRNRLEDLIAKLLRGERDPEASRKSRERMDVMREATRRRVGTVEVAVDFIRELRDQ